MILGFLVLPATTGGIAESFYSSSIFSVLHREQCKLLSCKVKLSSFSDNWVASPALWLCQSQFPLPLCSLGFITLESGWSELPTEILGQILVDVCFKGSLPAFEEFLLIIQSLCYFPNSFVPPVLSFWFSCKITLYMDSISFYVAFFFFVMPFLSAKHSNRKLKVVYKINY